MVATVGTIGLECKMYRNTGTFSSPTAVEVVSVMDVQINMERNVAVLKSRSTVWEKGLAGLMKGGATIKLLRNNADTDQIAFLAAVQTNPAPIVGLIFADGPFATTGTVYQKGDFIITKFTEGEPLEDGATVDMEVMPHGKSVNDPTWVTVGS
jgi:hypothetical protein